MSRLPILVRLTIAFAFATLLVLLAAALFVALRLRADLDDRVNANLSARSEAAIRAYREGTNVADVAVEDPEESFVQLLDSNGDVLETAGHVRGPAISAAEVQSALKDAVVVERELPGIDGRARILVRPVDLTGGRGVVATGQSLIDRDEALSSVVTSFAWGGAASVVLASVFGYGLARAGLSPVEAMRKKARQISFTGSPDALPLPPAHDEVRRLGETLNDMLDRLRDALEREWRFVADASHELRTPLAVMKTELEVALYAHWIQPDVRAALRAAAAECDRLTRLAGDLLVLARVDDGRLPLRLEQVNLRDLLSDVRDQYADAAAESGRYIDIDVPDTVVASGDTDRLRQVVSNLVDNAIRHGEGEVAVRAGRLDDGVEIVVTDQGEGFPESFIERAFERFSRADTSRGGEGAGLGLALVNTIVVAHGGRVWIDDDILAGVHLWLPWA